ncbi:MAG: patatin-like phospholipase family protein [Thiomonas arsenitoxydans]|uniref:Patatin-like phospholipase family protein n=2 Tax=Thiomonas TaxID=32012 RepID=A0A8I1SY37_THIA3|nr:patatin-like phospholipase family protein [Thiomonas arsenitoxydans]MBN8745116.1 patatin-like phospholipase family protein [Thiomonas arsenitoxydans]
MQTAPVSSPSTSAPRPRLGLALGGGAARGMAHLGVLRALADAGVRIDFIAGCSIGALVGAIAAAGRTDGLEATFKTFDWRKTLSFFDVVFPRSGLIDGAKVTELVREHLPATQIEALSIPFAAIATDLHSGAEVVLRSGDVIEAVRASIAVPGVFTPVRVHGRVLVDGGLSNPVPVSVVRAMGADQVIAVDLNHGVVDGRLKRRLRPKPRRGETPVEEPAGRWVADYRRVMADLKQRLQAPSAPAKDQFERWADREEPLPNMFEVLLASVNVMEMHITESRLRIEPPDLLIRPPLGDIRFLEFGRAEESIEIGYDAAMQALRGWNP